MLTRRQLVTGGAALAAYAALRRTPTAEAAFPVQTNVIDTFDRTADPLGLSWTIWYSGRELQANGSECVVSGTGTGDGRDVWDVAMSSATCECRCTVTTWVPTGESFYLALRLDNGSASAKNGYVVQFENQAGTLFTAILRSDAGALTAIRASTSTGLAKTDVSDIGMECSGSSITAYIKSSGSWAAAPGGSATDATYSAAGRPALAMGPSGAVDTYIGGPFAGGGTPIRHRSNQT